MILTASGFIFSHPTSAHVRLRAQKTQNFVPATPAPGQHDGERALGFATEPNLHFEYLYACIYIHTHIYIYTRIHTHTYMYIYKYIYIYI